MRGAWGRAGLGTFAGVAAIAVLLLVPGGLGTAGPGPAAGRPVAVGPAESTSSTAATAAAIAVEAAQSSLSQAWGGLSTGAGLCLAPSPCAALAGAPNSVSASPSTTAARIAFNPPPLVGASLAYDAADGYVVFFGGRYTSDLPSNQTWEFVSGRWLNLTPFLHSAPGARWDAMMGYDPKEGYVLLFGGCSSGEISGMCVSTYSDTWDFQAGLWTELIPNRPPPPPPPPPGVTPPPPPPIPPAPGLNNTGLWGGSMTYDAQFGGGSLILFGGADGLSDRAQPAPGQIAPTFNTSLSQWTWAWSAGAWKNVSSDSTVRPPEMYGAGLVSGLSDGSTVLFGGTNITRYDSTVAPGIPTILGAGENTTGVAYNETWTFASNGQWSELSFPMHAPIPGARYDFDLGVDPSISGGVAILYGGVNGTGAFLGDLWLYTPTPGGASAGAWSQVQMPNVPGADPSARWNSGFVWDAYSQDQYFLLYGGESAGTTPLSDAWRLTAVSPTLFLWLPMSFQPIPVPVTPGPRYEAAAAFDDYARSVVLFGGESCGSSACSFLGDTWTYANGLWSEAFPTSAPSARFGAAIAYDPLNGNVYLFGGCGRTCPLSDLWVYHQGGPTVAGTWTELYPPISPSGRYFATMTYDPADQAIVLFGGCEGSLGACPADDTWILSGTDTWTDLNLPSSASPPARFGAAAATVPGPLQGPGLLSKLQAETGPEIVLFGGMGSGGLLQDTWVYAPASTAPTLPYGASRPAAGSVHMAWREVQSPRVPDGRVFGTLAYDAADNALILFGGCASSGCPSLAPWNFTLEIIPPPPPGQSPPPTAGPWFPVNPPPSAQWGELPGGLYGSTGVWDPEAGPLGYVLVLGGRAINGETMPPEYEFSGMTWIPLQSEP
jgi:hypothetical protein